VNAVWLNGMDIVSLSYVSYARKAIKKEMKFQMFAVFGVL
jgi:hypothetical protein